MTHSAARGTGLFVLYATHSIGAVIPMAINRDLSKVTWKRIEDLLNRIAHRAVAIKADDIYKQADTALGLLRRSGWRD